MEISNEVHCANDGLEGLEYFQQLPEEEYPDLIFLDIHMLRMDGFEFVEELQYVGCINLSKLHIVMLTSSINMYDIQKSGSFGHLLKGYITKPLGIGAVKKVLESVSDNPE